MKRNSVPLTLSVLKIFRLSQLALLFLTLVSSSSSASSSSSSPSSSSSTSSSPSPSTLALQAEQQHHQQQRETTTNNSFINNRLTRSVHDTHNTTAGGDNNSTSTTTTTISTTSNKDSSQQADFRSIGDQSEEISGSSKQTIVQTLAASSSTTDETSNLALTSASSSLAYYYQPSLIGFRCDITNDISAKGVSIIEANRPVTLTLFGESFSTNTIVAFTTEFKPDDDENEQERDHYLSSYSRTDATTSDSSGGVANRLTQLQQSPETTRTQFDPPSSATSGVTTTPAPTASLETTTTTPLIRDLKQVEKSQNGPPARAAARRSYDCTDYNRVTSYRLREENILSPNVATLSVSLPELDSKNGELLYYFCIKQPKHHHRPGVAVAVVNGSSSSQRQLAAGAGAEHTSSGGGGGDEQLVWVHQGTDWWVTLKVEAPALSMANDCVLIILLLFLSAVTSGLNLGLMSLDMNELAVISSCGDQRERSYARTIAPLRRRGNFLLCSLLLGNVMVNSTLTVILEEMTSGVVAIIGSTLAIVVLGEIFPQAMCARHGLAIGAKTIYLTYGFMIVTFPLSYPIACLLDYFLGEEKGNVYDRERLMEFIKITGHHTQLEADEVAIISGALKLKKIKVDQIMTRIEDVFMLQIDCKLNRETIKQIIEKGYSRIPVYEFNDRRQIVALILAKDLALLDPDDHTPIASMLMYCKHPLIFIDDDATLDVALNEFKTGKSHMAVVRQIYDDGEVDKYYEAIGVVTLEDVIEEVLQVEINDETDTLSDNRRKRRRTDAQVTHLIDELTCRSLTSSTDHLTSPAQTAQQHQTMAAAATKGDRFNVGYVPQQQQQPHDHSNGAMMIPIGGGKSAGNYQSSLISQLTHSGSSPAIEGGLSGLVAQRSPISVGRAAAAAYNNGNRSVTTGGTSQLTSSQESNLLHYVSAHSLRSRSSRRSQDDDVESNLNTTNGSSSMSNTNNNNSSSSGSGRPLNNSSTSTHQIQLTEAGYFSQAAHFVTNLFRRH